MNRSLSKNAKARPTIALAAKMGLLPTPLASDNGEKVTGLERQDLLTKRVRYLTGAPFQLNPPYVAEMMGFPADWTVLPFQGGEKNRLKPTATR